MQRQWNIEIRADFADPEKNDAITQIVKQAARHCYANVALLSDQVKPNMACYSDDYFSGHEDINPLDDTIQQGLDAVGGDETAISEDMIQALKDSM